MELETRYVFVISCFEKYPDHLMIWIFFGAICTGLSFYVLMIPLPRGLRWATSAVIRMDYDPFVSLRAATFPPFWR